MTGPTLTKQDLDLIKRYLSTKKVAIVDANSATRNTIAKAFITLGANNGNIERFAAFHDGLEYIQNARPQIVTVDYTVDGRFGLELAQAHRDLLLDDLEKLFVLCAGGGSESSVAQAAEEDVDAFVIKPFTQKTLEQSLGTAVRGKLTPSRYRVLIGAAKKLIAKKEFDSAKTQLEEAFRQSKEPALAHYYMGQIAELSDNLPDAVRFYDAGLITKPNHYRCLTGLLDVLEKQNDTKRAYQALRQLVSHFPISPTRLAKVMKLAIYSGNFAEVGEYYDIFLALEHKSEQLVKSVNAAMLVCGKFLLKNGRDKEAIEAFKKAAVSSGRNPSFIYEAIEALVKAGKAKEADEFMEFFNKEDFQTEPYRVADFLVASYIQPPEQAITAGFNLVRDKLKYVEIYKRLNQLLKGAKNDKLQSLVVETYEQLFPGTPLE